MRLLTIVLSLLVFAGMLSPTLKAQDFPKAEVFGGFSYLNAEAIGRESFFGWQAAVGGNFRRNLGFVADFSGQYKSFFGVNVQVYELLIGPRYTKRGENITGFAHTLFGVLHATAGGFSGTAFAMGFGGGVDVNVSKRIAFRAFQIDYIPNRSSGVWSHEGRAGVGIVFKFGGG